MNLNRMPFCSLMPVLVDSPSRRRWYIEGAPELVAEIAASSAAIDLGRKCLSQWAYLVWQVFDQQIDWFSLQNADYMTLAGGGWCDL